MKLRSLIIATFVSTLLPDAREHLCIIDPGTREINRTEYTYPESIESENFKIHFTTSDTDSQFVNGQWFNLQSSQSYAQSIIDHAEAALSAYMEQGWINLPPDCDESINDIDSPGHCSNFGGNDLYDIYIANDAVGLVVPETPYPVEPYTGGYTSYMKISTLLNEYETLPSWSYHVIAHELHHSIQLRYGYSVSGSPGSYIYNGWFFEQSATYMENVIYPNSIHLRTMLANCNVVTPLTYPHYSIDYPSDIYPYRSALWQKFLVESLGDSSVVRYMWEGYGRDYASGNPTSLFPIYSEAVDIASNGSASLSDAYSEYAVWRYHTGSRSMGNNFFAEASNYCTSSTQSSSDSPFYLSSAKGSARFIELPSDDISLIVATEFPDDIQFSLVTVNEGGTNIVDLSAYGNNFYLTLSSANTNTLLASSSYNGQDSFDIIFSIIENGYNIFGDINSDGDVDILDVVMLIDYILNHLSEDLYMADLNEDGEVNVLDVVLLVSSILGTSY